MYLIEEHESDIREQLCAGGVCAAGTVLKERALVQTFHRSKK
jgi:hypothetical protein